MKFKKFIIFICLIVCMFSIASVCASDINDTVVASEDQSDDIISIENSNDTVVASEDQSDDIISIENSDNDEISVTEENELSADAGTFTDLADAIEHAVDDLILTKNYTYSTGDSSYSDGIVINKTITIDGNGFTINGNNQARAFSISAPNVVLKNFNFVNNKATDNGGAIWFTDAGTVRNCNFTGNSANNNGGAVYFNHTGTVTNCNFINNSI